MIKFIIVMCVSLYSLAANSQGPYASDTDLKAAYYLPFLKNDSEQTRRIMKIDGSSPKKEDIGSTLSNILDAYDLSLNKLKNYLVARNQSHNSAAQLEVHAAIRAGEQAVILWNKISGLCASQVKSQFDNKSSIDQYAIQIKSCKDENGLKVLKLDACGNLEFLPY
jgi:hypothetical protein